jgi:hypothetical protein
MNLNRTILDVIENRVGPLELLVHHLEREIAELRRRVRKENAEPAPSHSRPNDETPRVDAPPEQRELTGETMFSGPAEF